MAVEKNPGNPGIPHPETKPALTVTPLVEQPTYLTLQAFEGLVQRLQEGTLPTHAELSELLAVEEKRKTYTQLRKGKVQRGFTQHVSDEGPYERAFNFTYIGFGDELTILDLNAENTTRYALHYLKPSRIQQYTTDLSTVHAAQYSETIVLFSQKDATQIQAHIGINRHAKTFLINLSLQQPNAPQHIVLLVEPDKTTNVSTLTPQGKTRRRLKYFLQNMPH